MYPLPVVSSLTASNQEGFTVVVGSAAKPILNVNGTHISQEVFLGSLPILDKDRDSHQREYGM